MHIFTTDYLDPDERFSALSIILRIAMAVITLGIVLMQIKLKFKITFYSYTSFFIVSIADGYFEKQLYHVLVIGVRLR